MCGVSCVAFHVWPARRQQLRRQLMDSVCIVVWHFRTVPFKRIGNNKKHIHSKKAAVFGHTTTTYLVMKTLWHLS